MGGSQKRDLFWGFIVVFIGVFTIVCLIVFWFSFFFRALKFLFALYRVFVLFWIRFDRSLIRLSFRGFYVELWF